VSGQPLSAEAFERKGDTNYSLIPLLGNGENVLGRVCGVTKDTNSERRDAPSLNRLSTRDRRKESETVTLCGICGKVPIPEILGFTPARGLSGR